MSYMKVLPTTLSNGSAHGANELDPDSGDFLGDMDETCVIVHKTMHFFVSKALIFLDYIFRSLTKVFDEKLG